MTPKDLSDLCALHNRECRTEGGCRESILATCRLKDIMLDLSSEFIELAITCV